MLEAAHQRPDYEAAGVYIDGTASRRAVVIDGAVLSPGPLNGLDLALRQPRRVFRADAPQEREHPFGLLDPILPVPDVMRKAVAVADGAPIFLVTLRTNEQLLPGRPTYSRVAETLKQNLPPGYREVATRSYPGIVTVVVQEFRRSSGSQAGASLGD
jgi:hypothetical protein